MTQERIEELTKRFGRWTKEGYNGKMYDRIYFNAKDLGLKVEYYKTGNVSDAFIDGKRISNCECRRILGSKAYYDLTTDKLVIDSKMDQYFGEQIRSLIA